MDFSSSPEFSDDDSCDEDHAYEECSTGTADDHEYRINTSTPKWHSKTNLLVGFLRLLNVVQSITVMFTVINSVIGPLR